MPSAPADYAGELLAACCGSTLHLLRTGLSNSGQDKAIPSANPYTTAFWNRNNKVIAAACENGEIELRYSNGTHMSVLPASTAATLAGGAHSRSISDMSWSMGSKRLAVASSRGLCVHDMTSKTCVLAASGPFKAVAYHPDDRFVAAAGSRVSMFSVQQPTEELAQLPLDAGPTEFACLGVAAWQPFVAAGTRNGAVAVWDFKTQKKLHMDPSRHVGGTTAVQFVPLEPWILCSVGADGAVLLQDLRAGPFHVPTARLGTGVPLTALSLREDFKNIAVGTHDGKILLYDPRNATAGVEKTRRCGEASPVTCLHWQHNYQNVSAGAREAAAEEAATWTRRLSMNAYAVDALDAVSPDVTAKASQKDVVRLPKRDSVATVVSEFAPPRKLDLSPLVSHGIRESTVPNSKVSSCPPPPLEAELPRKRVASSSDVSSPSSSSAAVSVDGHAGIEQQTRGASLAPSVSNAGHRPESAAAPHKFSLSARPAVTAQTMDEGEKERETAGEATGGATVRPWSIKAATPKHGSPAKIPLLTRQPEAYPPKPLSVLGARKESAGGSTHPEQAGVSSLEEGEVASVHNDILALHLDMLNQFAKQQEATASLIAGVVARQDALAEEVGALRQELRDLLSRRDRQLWL